MDGARNIAERLDGAAPFEPDANSDGGAGADAPEPLDGAGSGGSGSSDGFPEVDDAVVRRCAGLDQNDTDNGRRLMAHFGGEWLHVRDIGNHGWTGTHWDMEAGEDHVIRLAQQAARLIKKEVFHLGLTEDEKLHVEQAEPHRKIEFKDQTAEQKIAIQTADDLLKKVANMRAARRKFAVSSGNYERTTKMIKAATPHCTFSVDDMDKDAHLFNVLNGTLKFSRVADPECPDPDVDRYIGHVELVPHDRAHRITKLSPATYDPDAKAPKFMAALARFQPEQDMRTFLQVYFGYCMLGHAGEQVFLFNYGHGANFKSTMVETLARLFGHYARSVAPESITGQNQRRGDQASPDIARLVDARFVYVEELPRGEQIKENLVKALTGGGKMTARHLNKGFFEFEPVFKAVMTGNDMPNITGSDYGIWRRVLIAKWDVIIPDAERRPMAEVLGEFDAERAGILNWLVEGALLYLGSGLKPFVPDKVTADTADYQEEMDQLGNFVRACVVPQKDSNVRARAMYDAYKAWCTANSIKAWQETAFGKGMAKRDIKKHRSNYVYYVDVALIDVPDGGAVSGDEPEAGRWAPSYGDGDE